MSLALHIKTLYHNPYKPLFQPILMMNILFLSEYYPPLVMGGGEINLAQIAPALVQKGLEVSVLTSFFPALPQEEIKEGVHIYRRLKTGSSPNSLFGNLKRSFLFPRSLIKEIKKLKKEINFDLIHLFGTSLIIAPRLKKLNQPLFATIESYPALCPKGDRFYQGKKECLEICQFKKFLACQQSSSEIGKMKNKFYLKYNPLFLGWVYYRYRKLNRALSFCHLIAISQYVQGLLAQQGYRSTVIPNALEMEKFEIKKNFRIEKRVAGKPKILYLGALIESKGPQVLLQALIGLDCRVDLYGHGVLKEPLQQYIQENNLDAEIHSPLPYEQIPSLYAQTDLIVFPSLWPEPFGRIVIEALASGKVIIASESGAIKEILESKRGIFFPPGEVQSLRKEIKKIIEHKNFSEFFFSENKRHVQENYSSKKVVSQLLNVYEQK